MTSRAGEISPELEWLNRRVALETASRETLLFAAILHHERTPTLELIAKNQRQGYLFLGLILGIATRFIQ